MVRIPAKTLPPGKSPQVMLRVNIYLKVAIIFLVLFAWTNFFWLRRTSPWSVGIGFPIDYKFRACSDVVGTKISECPWVIRPEVLFNNLLVWLLPYILIIIPFVLVRR